MRRRMCSQSWTRWWATILLLLDIIISMYCRNVHGGRERYKRGYFLFRKSYWEIVHRAFLLGYLTAGEYMFYKCLSVKDVLYKRVCMYDHLYLPYHEAWYWWWWSSSSWISAILPCSLWIRVCADFFVGRESNPGYSFFLFCLLFFIPPDFQRQSNWDKQFSQLAHTETNIILYHNKIIKNTREVKKKYAQKCRGKYFSKIGESMHCID